MKRIVACVITVLFCIIVFIGCSQTDNSNNENKTHAHIYSTSVMAPTCSEQGYTLHTCSCGDSFKDNYKNALGHFWVNGERNYSCSRCNQSETDGFTFHLATLDGESCYTITGVESKAVINGVLEIPRKYESLPVRGVMNWAFSAVTAQVTKIIIHDNIKNIYSDILHGTGIWTPDWDTMSTLEEIVFDDTCSDMRIEAGAFNNCPKLAKVNVKKGMIKYAPADAITTQNGGTGEYLFKGTPYFEDHATIKNGLYYIADLLLYADLNEIESNVVVDNGTVYINPCLFDECTFLKSVTLPDSILSIGSKAFHDCSNLDSIRFNGTIAQFNTISIGVSAFANLKTDKIMCADGIVTEYHYNDYTYHIGK